MESIPVEFDPFRAGEIARTEPTTEPQREIITSAYLGDQANTAFNEAVSLRVSGAIDPVRIEVALRTIVERHDALRMTFTRQGNELCVSNQSNFSLERLDLAGQEESAREERIQALWRELVCKPMNLFEGPLFRAIWIQLGDGVGELVLLAHHVVCDGWSFHVILEELSQLCSGTKPEDLAEATSFADFAERQSVRAVSNADADYWAKRFETKPPVLDLPTDGARPPFRSFSAERIDYAFDPDLVRAIGAAAGKMKASVVNVALAGVAVLLHRLTGESDLAIGLPLARQGAEGPPGLVGHSVQLLALRLQVEPSDSFQELVGRAKTAVLDAREHFDFTFGTLIRDLGLSGDPSRVPLVPVVFNIDQSFGEIRLGSASATLRTVPRTAENFEIFLNILPAKDRLVLEATFNTDLFGADTIRNWLAALESLLADGAANPGKTVSALKLSRQFPPIYAQLNATAREHQPASWLERLAETASRQASADAVVDGKGTLTYGELDRRSVALARMLLGRGVKQGSVVGIYMTRSRELMVALTAVHRAGAAYLPLDPSFPEARLGFMLSDAGAQLLLTDLQSPPVLAAVGVETLVLPNGDKANEAASDMPLPQVGAADLAYVIYTSGSTGKPKGVEVLHGGVANFLDSMAARPGFGRDDTLLAVTTLSFDISVLELLLPLTRGGRVVIATRDEAANPGNIAELLSKHSVSVMQATPSTWRLLMNNGWPGRAALTALCGGEPLPADLASAIAGKVKKLWNLYGPTETTIWSTCEQIGLPAEQITVGRPIDNTTIYVMDTQGEPLPAAIPGEIWIGGAGVSRGYHGRPDLTAERFVEHADLGRLYRTGDRGRLLDRGVIEHLGRMDDQVKVRGFRIELAEIESALAEHPGVRQAAVHLWTAKADDVRIVACCVPAQAGVLPTVELRKFLRARLPEYMVPQYFLMIDEIPLMPNGKIARRALPVPTIAESRIRKHEAPADSVESGISEIWTRLVHPARPVGRTDKFFDIGGHSLLGLEALRQIEERFGARLDPRVLFNESLSEIAARSQAVQQSGRKVAGGADRPGKLAPGTEILLSEDQERIYRAWQADPGGLQYHVPFSFRLTGQLNPQAFVESLQAVFARHAALRTVIAQGKSGLVQKVLPVERALALDRSDLSGNPSPKETALALLADDCRRPFDLVNGPVVRMRLIKLGERLHHFFFMPHQIMFDGWSFDIVLKELEQGYALLEAGNRLEPEIPGLDYGDFTTWQRQHGAAQDPNQTKYWQDSLRDLPPAIRWPGSGVQEPRVGREQFVIARDVMDRYEAYCSTRKIRPQTLLLAAFVRALGATLGRSDLLIGLASSGRSSPEAAPLVGLFYRSLPVRMNLAGPTRAEEFLERVQAAVQATTENQHISPGELAKLTKTRVGGGGLLHQVAFSFQDARNRRAKMGSLGFEQVSISRPDLENDLEFWVRNTPSGLVSSLDYRARIASNAFMEALRDDLVRKLDELAQNPASLVGTQSSGAR